MRDHELRSLLNLVDEPADPPTEFVDSLWAEIEATLAVEGPTAQPTEGTTRMRVYLMVAAALVVVLGAVAVLLVKASEPASVEASPDLSVAPLVVADDTPSTANPTCDLFVADGELSVIWRTGVVSGTTSNGYRVESDASADQLSGSAEAVNHVAARVASSEGPARHIAGQLERVSVNLGRASLLMQFDERVLAQKAIERARAELVGLAFEPGLDECIDPASWAG